MKVARLFTVTVGLVLCLLPARVSAQPFVFVAADSLPLCLHGCGSTAVYVVNTATGATSRSFGLSDYRTDRLAATVDGRKVYAMVVLWGDPLVDRPGALQSRRIVPFDLTTQQTLPAIPLADDWGVLTAAMAPDGKRLYAATEGSGVLSVVDTASDTIVGTLTVGGSPRAMAISPSGTRLYLLDRTGGAIRVIDLQSLSVAATYAAGPNPVSMAVGPDGSIHVADGTEKSLTILREADGGIARTIALAAPATAAILNAAGTKLFVLENSSSNDRRLETITLPLGTSVSLPLPGGSALDITPDGRRVIVLRRLDGTSQPETVTIDGITGGLVSTANLATFSALKDVAVVRPFGCAVNVQEALIFDRFGGTKTLEVPAPPGCVWSAETDSTDIRVAPAGGYGPGAITISVGADNSMGLATTVRLNGQSTRILRAIPKMVIDTPGDGAVTMQPFNLGGWAVDDIGVGPLVAGTGVNTVHLWAFPLPTGPPRFVGATDPLGWVTRIDVSQALGGTASSASAYAPSGFNLPVSGLPPGRWRLAAYAFSTRSNAFNNVATVELTIEPRVSRPAMVVDSPRDGDRVAQSFPVSGWAIDRGALSGTGVDVVHVWAYPDGGAAPVFVGAATYSLRRPDVAAFFGNTQFDPSGFALAAQGVVPGKYTLVAFARSTLTGQFNIVQTVRLTVEGGAALRPRPR